MIDFDWYRSFLAVYRAGTVSGAAQARFLTQPAVTQHLQALEAAIGQPLFVRSPRRMLPTERGQSLYNQVALSLEKLEQVSEQLRSDGHPTQTLFRIGAPLEFFYEVGLPCLPSDFRYRLRFDLAQPLLDALEREDLDLVISSQRVAVRAIEYERLTEETFWLVGDSRIELPSDLANFEEWLGQQRWLSYGVELPIIRRFWQSAFGHRPDFQPALVLPNLHALQRAVELGHGLSVLPDYLCQSAVQAGQLRILWQPPQPITNELWLAYRRFDRSRADLKKLRTALKNGTSST